MYIDIVLFSLPITIKPLTARCNITIHHAMVHITKCSGHLPLGERVANDESCQYKIGTFPSHAVYSCFFSLFLFFGFFLPLPLRLTGPIFAQLTLYHHSLPLSTIQFGSASRGGNDNLYKYRLSLMAGKCCPFGQHFAT